MMTIVKNDEMERLPVAMTESPCMDCIFWYQCRRGEIDCHLRPLRSIENKIRA